MNKFVLMFFVYIFLFVLCSNIIAQEKQIEPKNQPGGLKKSAHYNPDGSLDCIIYIYSDGDSYKNFYDKQERLYKKVYGDGREVDYEYSNEGKTVTEIYSPGGKTVVRKLNVKGEVIESIYPEGTEKYTYVYTKLGDIEKIKVLTDDGSEEELTPDNKKLLFLNDYAIIEDDMKNYKHMREYEYLYNPKKFKEKLMMHRKKFGETVE